MGYTKDKVKQVLLRKYSVEGFEDYVPAENIEDIDEEQKFKNFSDAIHIGYTKENEYSKINVFSRFFSHFVPNSWTKAGQLRNEIKECDDAFKEVGYTKKDLDDYYKKSLGEDLYKAQVVARAKQHFFTKTTEKELREYAKENMIAEPLDLSDYIKEDNEIEEYNETYKEFDLNKEIDSGILEEESEDLSSPTK